MRRIEKNEREKGRRGEGVNSGSLKNKIDFRIVIE